ncbi:MAG TPA: glycosyltransferase family 2 protein [Ruminiclostridium sp.]|nr:glycosyltransferase family 2 protein [Ruminiclostridium sp.]
MNTIYFVVPCYNEEEVISETVKQLSEMIKKLESDELLSNKSRILLVDDGSRDRTWDLISGFSESTPYVCGVKLSRNCGHQNALLAGLMTAKDFCDAAISLDADLQDDISVIPEFITKFNEGCEIVYGVRNSRATDTVFKRGTAHGFYKIMKIMGVDLVSDHADYRLMSKRAIESLAQFTEVNLFLRGIMPLIGFKTANVYYQRHERFAGESKYPLKKMIAFALDGITSFSTVPLKLIGSVGFIVCIISLFALVYSLVSKLTGNANAGWASIVGSIWFIGGIQLLSAGICGEYIGKIYKEVKARPHYIIDTTIIK